MMPSFTRRPRDLEERVILVAADDREIGWETKLTAHTRGKLHRAVSVMVFDRDRNILLQRRAASKYHSAGLWSNTCCGHPRPGESSEEAAHRRLQEEMGFDCPLRHVFNFVYRCELGNGMVEHEHDHVFAGRFEGVPAPDPDEVHDWRWVKLDAVMEDVVLNPRQYAPWFSIMLERFRAGRDP